MSATDVSKWIFPVFNSVLARVVFSKSLVVSFEFPPVMCVNLLTPVLLGNYYSFANTHHKEARLFFTQGCVPDESESENENDTQGEIDNDNDMSAVSQNASPETEVEPETTPAPAPAKKAKGRPKGKQKKDGK